jgi:hypothetical protein
MKRSEMLSKIASVIINYNEVDSVIKREKALEMAETILQVQEEVGMLPPHTNLKDCDDPELQVYVDSIDIPYWIILGWDKE